MNENNISPSHPGQTQGSTAAKVIGSIGYLAIGGVLSVTITPIVGMVGTGVYAVKGVIYKLKEIWYELKEYDLRNNPLNFDLDGEQKEYVKLQLEDIRFSATNNRRDLVASLLASLPLFGVAAAAIYLKQTDEDVEDKGVHGGVEAFVKWSTPRIVQKVGFSQLYPTESVKSSFEIYDKVDVPKTFNLEVRNNLVDNFNKLARNRDGILATKNSRFDQSVIDSLTTETRILAAKVYKIDAEQIWKEYFDEVEIDVSGTNGTKLQMFQNKNFDVKKPCVIMFHGNGMVRRSYSNAVEAQQWKEMGYNVIVATMRGYPDSGTTTIQTTESSTMQDVNAILTYLDKKDVKEIAAYGLSIGGTMACMAAELRPDLVKVVIADQTLGSAKNVAANTVRNIPILGPLAPTSVIRGVFSAIFDEERVPGVKNLDETSVYTDGLNNQRKARLLKGKKIALIVISADEDSMMGRDQGLKNEKMIYSRNFSDDLIESRYDDDEKERKSNHIMLSGQHSASLWDDIKGRNSVLNFLKQVFINKC